MKLNVLGLKDRMSRREFLKIIQLKNHVRPLIDKEKCTGCGLCTIDCPAKALTVNQSDGRDIYQLLFRQGACDACGVCERSCPEHCLRLAEKEPEEDQAGEGVKVVFEDNISRCLECGIPLFPRAKIDNSHIAQKVPDSIQKLFAARPIPPTKQPRFFNTI